MKTIEEMIELSKAFHTHTNLFLVKVGRAGLWERIDEVRERGMRATFENIELRTYVIAGRTMITIADATNQITFLTDDKDRDGLWYHTSEGSTLDCILLIAAVIDGWPSDPDEQRRIFKSDSAINVGI